MNYKERGLICRECGKKMLLDDKDFRFQGNLDIYWICENCHTSCIEEIRFNQSYQEWWHSEEKGFDYNIKKKIDFKKGKYEKK